MCMFLVLLLHFLHVHQIFNFQKDRGYNFSASLKLFENFKKGKKKKRNYIYIIIFLTAQHHGQTQTSIFGLPGKLF